MPVLILNLKGGEIELQTKEEDQERAKDGLAHSLAWSHFCSQEGITPLLYSYRKKN